jgi:hypothetical protein
VRDIHKGTSLFFTTCGLRFRTHLSFFLRMPTFSPYVCAQLSNANVFNPHANGVPNTVRVLSFCFSRLSLINLTKALHFPCFHRWQKVTFCHTHKTLGLPPPFRGALPLPHAHGTRTSLCAQFPSFPFCLKPDTCVSSSQHVHIRTYAVISRPSSYVFMHLRRFLPSPSLFFLRLRCLFEASA